MSEQEKRQQEKDERTGHIVAWTITGQIVLFDWYFNDLQSIRRGFGIMWAGLQELNDWLVGLVF